MAGKLNEALCTLVAGIEFVKSNFDKSLYIHLEEDTGLTVIVAYVDEVLIVSRDDSELHKVSVHIERHVKLRVGLSVTKFLKMGVDYNEEDETFKISNGLIIDWFLCCSGLQDANLVPTQVANGT